MPSNDGGISPVGEHQSNGEIENAVRNVQAKFRTLKSAIESNLKEKMYLSLVDLLAH